MMKFKLWKAVACLAVLVAGAGRGEAASYKLSDLLAGGSFTNGDKLFWGFHNQSETGTRPSVGYENIYLTPISQDNRDLDGSATAPFALCNPPWQKEHGFRVSGSFDVVNQDYNLGFDFKVTSARAMYAVEMEITGNALNGEVDSSLNVTQGLTSLAGVGANIHDPENIPDVYVDRDYFGAPTMSVCAFTVEASFGLQLDGGSASLEHADVYFAQAIPEPSTYALLVLGSAGVGLMVRRKRS
jgi:hypothetical protein